MVGKKGRSGGPNNPKGNPDIAKHAKRFGTEEGPDPRAARAKATVPASIRKAVREISSTDIDLYQQGTDAEVAAQIFKGKPNQAQILAVKQWRRALIGDNERYVFHVEDVVDGKMVEKKVEATTTLEDLLNRADELEKEEY